MFFGSGKLFDHRFFGNRVTRKDAGGAHRRAYLKPEVIESTVAALGRGRGRSVRKTPLVRTTNPQLLSKRA